MESKSIIVSVLAELEEVLTCFGNQVGMDEQTEVPQIGRHKHISFPLLLLDHVIYFIPDFCFFEVSE
jgi:hypothetical protein